MLFKAVADLLPASCSLACTLERGRDDYRAFVEQYASYQTTLMPWAIWQAVMSACQWQPLLTKLALKPNVAY